MTPGFIPDGDKVRADGNFEVKGVFGLNRFNIAPMPDGWAIRRVDFNGRDVAASGVDPQSQTLEGVTITLTNRFLTVSGALRDAKGNPMPSATAILFPDDQSLWVEDLRTIRTARVDQSGTFTVKALRPGDYLAVAVPGVQNNQWNDPEFLETLRDQAQRFTVAEGESKTVNLIVK
jgi:Carboxypeptidase regulatory-like domain